ncbi:sisA family protein [Megaselia abdita]
MYCCYFSADLQRSSMENLTSLDAGLLLKPLYSTLSQNFKLLHESKLAPRNIQLEMDREMSEIKDKYFQEEELFVNQMIRDNPVENLAIKSTITNIEKMSEIQKQRSEACRKSRMNNKIKKAKCKYRHKFITSKLSSSSTLLTCIKDVIAHTESKLIKSGFDSQHLFEMKITMGIQHLQTKMEL